MNKCRSESGFFFSHNAPRPPLSKKTKTAQMNVNTTQLDDIFTHREEEVCPQLVNMCGEPLEFQLGPCLSAGSTCSAATLGENTGEEESRRGEDAAAET